MKLVTPTCAPRFRRHRRGVTCVADLVNRCPQRPSQPHPLRVLVVMDPIDEIKPVKDTTLAMLLAAQKRGWELWYAEQRDLWLRDGIAYGRVRPISVRNDLQDWFTLDTAHTQAAGGLPGHPDAQGSAVRHGVHLHHLHPRTRRGAGRAGGEPAAGPAGHERESVHRLVPAVLRADADHAGHGRHARFPARAPAHRLQAACTAWAGARSSSSTAATRTPTSCSRR